MYIIFAFKNRNQARNVDLPVAIDAEILEGASSENCDAASCVFLSQDVPPIEHWALSVDEYREVMSRAILKRPDTIQYTDRRRYGFDC